MRPVVLQMGVTLDGFVHGAKGYEDWGLPKVIFSMTLTRADWAEAESPAATWPKTSTDSSANPAVWSSPTVGRPSSTP